VVAVVFRIMRRAFTSAIASSISEPMIEIIDD